MRFRATVTRAIAIVGLATCAACGGGSADEAAPPSDGGGTPAPVLRKNEQWLTGLGVATAFAQAPDGRLFVCEQGGRLRVVKGGALLAAPFHSFTVDSSGERGLLGVAFDPAFASNGLVYVYYTATTPDVHNRVSRLSASGDVSTGAESVLMELPPLGATNHNGGALHFGLDGKLYVGVGDNAVGTRAQDLASVFGKILRLNPDGTFPSDNPFFASATGQARAIWAYGLRNPFTFAIEPGSGRIHINDVGELTWEEIDVGIAGANYGWPGSEGPDNVGAGVAAPLYAYRHAGAGGFPSGQAIAGGAFYPATGPFPAAYRGSYFFADFVGRWIARLDPANGNAASAFDSIAGSPVDLLVGQDGALYVLTHEGSITRIGAP